MKKGCVLLIVLLLSVSGCQKRKRKGEPVKEKNPVVTQAADVAIPMANNQSRSFFDEDLEEFELVDQADNATTPVAAKAPETTPSNDFLKAEGTDDEFAWVEADEKQDQKELNVVYFDFDRYVIKQNEEQKVVANTASLKKMLDDQEKKSVKATVVIEGHACHSAGSAIYNLALSEKRAKVLADRLVEAGICRSQIKIVGRGKEFPAIVEGKPVTGSRDQQWPNRRDEISIINA